MFTRGRERVSKYTDTRGPVSRSKNMYIKARVFNTRALNTRVFYINSEILQNINTYIL